MEEYLKNTEIIDWNNPKILSGSGICYAKSHLLAALLRANKIPAGFCYPRLSAYENGSPYFIHAKLVSIKPQVTQLNRYTL